MTRPRRWRWWGKWAAVATTVLLAATWFASGWWIVMWGWDSTKRATGINVGAGAVYVSVMRLTQTQPNQPWPGTINLWKLSAYPGVRGPLPLWQFRFNWETGAYGTAGLVPLWAPGCAGLLATLILFYLDRGRPPNSCPHCRYDLSATPPSAPCPECGRAQKSPNAEAAEGAERMAP